MRRSDYGKRQIECGDCLLPGVQPFRTRSAVNYADHQRLHEQGLITYTCGTCHVEVDCNDTSRTNHERICRVGLERRTRARADGGDENALCPRCGVSLEGRSRNAVSDHRNLCNAEEAAASAGDGGIEIEDGNMGSDDFRADLGPAPPWAGNFYLSDQLEGTQVYQLEECDKMLLYAIEAAGIRLSDAAWTILYKVFNSSAFDNAYRRRQISSSYKKIADMEKEAAKSMWKEVKHNDSIVHVRDMREVVADMMKDESVMERADFELRDVLNVEPDDDDDEQAFVFGDRFTLFDPYQQRLAHVRNRFGSETVRLLSLGLWLDEGEMDDNGNPIYVIALFLLNAPVSLLRRADCIFPIAYTYTQSNIVDAFRYLLPQFESLRDLPRLGQDQNIYVSELHLVTGDNPAITKLMMVMKSSTARIPCKNCMIENAPSSGLLLNDPSRWLNNTSRTQVGSNEQVLQMRQGRASSKETGMGEENMTRSNPLFLYCGPFIEDAKLSKISEERVIDAFRLRAGDLMHDLFLGLVKEVAGVMAQIVIAADKPAKKRFLAACVKVNLAHVRGFNMTILRAKDVKESSQTTLVDLLSKQSLYAREYQELLPLLPLLFHAAEVEAIDRAIPVFCDFMAYCTFLQSRQWPPQRSTELVGASPRLWY